MLAQAARRRSQRDVYRHLTRTAQQLYLPWLCPALYRSNATSLPGQSDPENRTAQRRHRTTASNQSRNLATTAEAISQIKASIPFDQISQNRPERARHAPRSPKLPSLSQWKDSQPLVIHSATTAPPPRLHYHNGIGGDPAELHSNLHACLRVGRLDRAAALVRRLRELYNPSATELVEANNLYLLHMMDRVIAKQPGYTINAMSTWFEVEMRENDIQPDAVTYTCMLRTAIATLESGKRDRLIRRYLWLAEQSGILESVLTNEAWSDEEYAVLAEVRPDLISGDQPTDPQTEAEQNGLEDLGDVIGRPTPMDDIPELRAVEQKGLGLTTVKSALSIFMDKETLRKVLPYPHDLQGYTQEEKDTIYARMRQDRLEEDSIDASIERWRQEHQNMQKMGITSALQTKPMEALMWQWYSAMVPLFKQEFESINAVYGEEEPDLLDERLVTGPFLEAFTPEKLAATALIVTVSTFGMPDHFNGIKVSQIAMAIGKQLAMEHSLMVAQTVHSNHSVYRNVSARRLRTLLKYSKTVNPNETKSVQETNDEGDIAMRYQSLKHLEWAPLIKAKVGALCLSKILEAAKIPVTREEKETRRQLTSNEPAFYHATVYSAGRKSGMIRLHQQVLDKLRREPMRGSFGTKYPMIVEPLPWTGYRRGGYLRYPEPIIKEKKQDDAQRIYAMAAIEKGDMDQVLAGLSVLGKTAWKVNRDVFKVVVEAWNTGEPIGKIAPENPKMEYPPEPGPEASKKDKALYLNEKKRIDNAKMSYHSQRCFQNFQLEVARAFKDEVFYFPHNMDFRGRAYPIPPLLNHLGADLARGLLTFAKGKQLGPVGLSWLKIHLANVYGYDKASLKDREAFAMEHIQDIYDSCENPLTGRKWWLKAEDPWQCLATCFELKHAFDSPDPSQYISHLPVHQDGTCNGLQHYAALGGDKAGAAQVNLEPGDRPSDIYSAVAEIVKKEVAKDAESGDRFARILDGNITRKVVKQTVMTNVYGVTFTGARLQVIKQLEAILPEEYQVDSLLFTMGGYVAKLIFKALGQMFNGAQEIQDWLGACANRISTALTPEQIDVIEAQLKGKHGEANSHPDSRYRKKLTKKKSSVLTKDLSSQFSATVIWTTPLKMPVVQPYRRSKSREITTVLQYLSIVQPKSTDAIDKRKQLQAFPPNFIHSLDATHMLLSALKCNEIGLSFASVHDSFWTHAADVPLMNRVLRDAFVRMHSEDIVGRLHEEFSIRYQDCIYLATVPSASPLGQQILAYRRDALAASVAQSKKRTGHMLINELLQERERQRLLKSADEAEREKGKQMMTPGALFDAAKAAEGEEAAEVELTTDDEAPVARLGDTTDAPAPPKAKGTAKKKAGAVDAVDEEVPENDVAEDEDVDDDLLEGVMGSGESANATTATAPDAAADSEERMRQRGEARKRKAAANREAKVKFWLPMHFPPVPKKGDFDVTRLKESTYFFS
ncbi:DNA-directed RNA polymerase bacteriophage type [Macrophomina phaseolina MS6]|uniref:DNA-directed RNA polymerase n=1 Tax=Macrophomina phaseolina (strain MS6) TaxID=1126212 RepID=K2RJP7_MACPH|nr:DNA-directed RNA polymerase bacteriophage type [Macrophomina phaseolina MS6]